MRYILLFSLLFIVSCNLKETKVEYSYRVKPKTYIDSLYYYSSLIEQQYCINKYLPFTQAILEQGYKCPKDYRIFNISKVGINSPINLKGELKQVYDNIEKRKRYYRVYQTMEDAFADYALVIKTNYIAETDTTFNQQVSRLSKYATDTTYIKNLKSLYKKYQNHQFQIDTIYQQKLIY